ncbi:hypothetical protein UFOVP112_231 [uncultured Caudovirales phage]|uniref:Uncharacterized protein n=1 Tax=uncultured Caudovirales phage TaxID=2100421 RepID=A0A6J5L703_9CAUD|nr:hypothetical protein UFOVP112_231 [uncultured Caudovirales phage]
MAQYKHPHVEDYIEIIAGYREPNGKSNHNIFTIAEPIISLARYDMKVVPSLAEQSIGGQGYTDKQAKLATELVLKYERQLSKLNIDITPVRTPVYRLPLRTIDRQCRVWLDNDTIKVKFPYNAQLIDTVREATKTSKGHFAFDRNARVYNVALTEWNLNWVYSFALQNNFEIDMSVKDLMNLVLDVEKNPYKIELCYTNDSKLNISNAADSLIDYIENNLGGLELENILTLCDNAPILGYTVHADIVNDVTRNFGTRFWNLCANRHLKVNTLTNHALVKDIAEYARLNNRFPIYVYEPDLSKRLHTEFNKYFPDSIMTLDNKVMDTGISSDVKVVYTTKIPRTQIGRIPLLVSSAGMLFGGDRQVWIQTAEKVVYFTNEVYNKSIKGPDVCKLD